MWRYPLRKIVIQRIEIGQTSAQHHQLGVKQRQDVAQTDCQQVTITFDVCQRGSILLIIPGDYLRRTESLLIKVLPQP